MVADGCFGVYGLAGWPGYVGKGPGPSIYLAIIFDDIECQLAFVHTPGVMARGVRTGGVVEE
jgi:hypothetical protein